jgi:hypothetical protein
MKDVRYNDEKGWLHDESVVGLGRPLWTAKRQGGDMEELQEFAQ